VGLNHYAVFRLVVIVLHLLCGPWFLCSLTAHPTLPALLRRLIPFLGAAGKTSCGLSSGYILSWLVVLGGVRCCSSGGRWSEKPRCCRARGRGSSASVCVMVGARWSFVWRPLGDQHGCVDPAFLYLLWYLGYGESQRTENGLSMLLLVRLGRRGLFVLVGRALEWGVRYATRHTGRTAPPYPPGLCSARLARSVATGVRLVGRNGCRSIDHLPNRSQAATSISDGRDRVVGIDCCTRSHHGTCDSAGDAAGGFRAITGHDVLHAGAMAALDSKAVTAELGALELAAAYAPRPISLFHTAPQIMGTLSHTRARDLSTPADTPAEMIASEPQCGRLQHGLVSLASPNWSPLGAVSRRRYPAACDRLACWSQGAAAGRLSAAGTARRHIDESVFTLPTGGSRFTIRARRLVAAVKRFRGTFGSAVRFGSPEAFNSSDAAPP